MYGDVPETMATPKTDRAEGGSEEYDLPKAVLMGQEAGVGDELTLTITQIGDDTVRVKYASEPESSEPVEGEEEISAPKEDEMAAMME